MTQIESLRVLHSYLDDYLETASTPFKCNLTVAKTEAEITFVTDYRKHLEEMKKQISPETQTQQPTTGLGLGGTGGFPGFPGFGTSTTTPASSNPFGTSTTSSAFSMTGTQQTQPKLPEGMREIGNNRCEIDIFFFDGLEYRLKYQQKQQADIQKKLEDISEKIKSLMSEIQTKVIERLKKVQKESIEIDKKIIAKLCENGNFDASVVAKFRDLNGKIEMNDLKSKTEQLLSILQNKKMDDSQQHRDFSEETKNEVMKLLYTQHELILKFVSEVSNLQGKYQQLKSTLTAMNEGR